MNQPKKERFKTSVGGQALMEGIMMRGPQKICCAVRKPDGTIETKIDPVKSYGVWRKIPLVRGAIAMIESLIVGYRYMMYSAQVSMGDDYDPAEEETAFEKWVGVGSSLVSMVPSGLRTAQHICLGPRIMMPSISACPPTLVLKRSFLG